jgi:thioester reductase-like protein
MCYPDFTSPEPAEETAIPEPSMAVGTGYSESKWVTERILDVASQRTTMRTTVVRIGQLSGSSKNGAWNVKEWVPAIIRGGQIIGCLPFRDEVGDQYFTEKQDSHLTSRKWLAFH